MQLSFAIIPTAYSAFFYFYFFECFLMKSQPNPELDPIFDKQKLWKAEMLKLREICLESGLDEVKKWWQPCYAYNGTNLLIIGSFKEFCTLSFFKGVLLKDEQKILEFAGPNTQSAKIVKITSLEQIEKLEPHLKAYIGESIDAEKSGRKVEFKKIDEQALPEELEGYFKEHKDFEEAFKSLTPGRQRSWLLHYTSAKQSATKISRIEKSREKVFAGKGMQD